MNSKSEILNDLLKEEKEYSIFEIKESLRITSNYELALTVTRLLESIGYSKKILSNPEKYTYLFKAFKYIDMYNVNYSEKYEIINGLCSIKNACCKIIKKISDKKEENEVKVLKFYSEIISNLDYILLKEKATYKFVQKLFFEVKNVNYVNNFFSQPILSTLSKNDVQQLFNDAVKIYIYDILLKPDKNDCYEAVYYERLIKILLSENLNIDNHLFVKKIFNQLKNCEKNIVEHLKNQCMSDDVIDRKISSIKNLLNVFSYKINGKKINTKNQIIIMKKTYDIKEEHDYKLLNGIKKYDLMKNSIVRDYRNRYIITIDSDCAGSFEDSFSIEVLPNGNYMLGIYISDVASQIKRNSPMNKEAYERGETIYVYQNNITMFHPFFALDKFSLRKDTIKSVQAFTFEFTENAELVNYNIENAIINVKRNLKFRDVDNLLKTANNNKCTDTVIKLIKLVDKLNVPISFEEKNKIEINDKNCYISKKQSEKVENSSAYQIASKLAIFLNKFIGEYCDDRKKTFPSLYRVSNYEYDPEKRKEIMTKLSDTEYDNSIFEQIDRLSNYSLYSTVNTGHNNFGIRAYCHCTNPIRSYASLTTQRIIKDFIIDKIDDDNYKVEIEKLLKEEANHLNKRIFLNEEYKNNYEWIKKKN